MKYSESNKPLQCMMTQSTCYKGTRKMEVKGVLWHSTGANNPNLKRYVQPDDNAANRAELLAKLGKNAYKNDWNHIDRQAGLNCWIGKLADGTVTTVQTMPWDYRPWGCGSGKNGSCNNGWIQFEICEDNLTDKDYFQKVYTEACEITAYLCKMFNIDPTGTVTVGNQKVPTILCHADSYKLGLGSNHGDVYTWFNKHGKTMDNVRQDVKALLNAATPKPAAPAGSIKTGSLVKIVGTKYYSGKAIPAWVKASNWYVKEISGDRAVIDKSEDGKNSICSAINISDIALVDNTSSPAPAAPKPTTPATTKPTFAVGDKVKCKSGVTKFSNGNTMASWVRTATLYVRAVEQSGKVLLVSTEKTKKVYTGRVNAADVQKV